MTAPLIEISEVAFSYPKGAFALRVPSLEIANGETVAFTGRSGCGKTTLANLISGILVPSAGSVSVAGRAISALPDSARRAFRVATIGYLFQDFGLLDYLSAEDNILLPYVINRALKPDADAARPRARELAGSLGIADRLGSRPAQLSGGERQRIALARALVTRPKLLIADEPTGNLDPETAAQPLDLLFTSVAEHHITLLTITHDPTAAARHGRSLDLRDLSSPPPTT